AFDNVTTALTVTAQYTINSYEVSFVDWDGEVLKTENVDYGSSATAPSDPTRTGYSFTGWDVVFDNITTALIVTAQYTINSYTVTFVDWDGGVLKTENVDYGSSATAPVDHVRIGYTFTGWDVAFDNITTALTVTAQYTINSYTVTFVDWDGGVLKTENVDYGSSATAPADPARTGYSFTGWDVAFDNVTTALTVTAQYTI
ncbi:InlB B-repeat-containing protein, partial [Carboxylicivirga linearis]|uniref:InlB B-repeat-containing protein n=1 Tax=Carboxylicivirga linearis TaxID=1628157 RepID=UPI001FD51337